MKLPAQPDKYNRNLEQQRSSIIERAIEQHDAAISGLSSTTVTWTATKTAGTTFSLYVDIDLAYSQFSSFLLYRFRVADNASTYDFWGQILGDQIVSSSTGGKTAAVSNNNGMVRLTLGTFSHPTGLYSISGAVRKV